MLPRTKLLGKITEQHRGCLELTSDILREEYQGYRFLEHHDRHMVSYTVLYYTVVGVL